MKKSIIGLLAVLLTTTSAFATVAPQYLRLRIIDAAVEEMATNYLKLETSDEAQIAGIVVQTPELILVAIKDDICAVSITTKATPGLAGAPKITAKISKPEAVCGKLDRPTDKIKTKSYEKISEKLDRAAELGKTVEELEITSRGSLKIKYQKNK